MSYWDDDPTVDASKRPTKTNLGDDDDEGLAIDSEISEDEGLGDCSKQNVTSDTSVNTSRDGDSPTNTVCHGFYLSTIRIR